jgi:hypothetical protein
MFSGLKTRRERASRREARPSGGAGTPRWAEPVEPPDCPPGWTTGPPDFVGIGAQRCGTSWWYRGLEAHPGVARVKGRRKELHYFNRFWDGAVPEDMAAGYRALFPRPEGALVGEWTPRYLYDYWAMPLLREAAPDARLLVLLRDPVERYRSGLAFAQARAERSGTQLRLAQLADAVWRGFYGEQLRHAFRIFPREQLLVLQFERCRAEPLEQMRRTCEFLGLDPPGELPEAMERRRPPREKPPLPDRMRAELVARLAADVSALAELCPEIDLALWPNFDRSGASGG